MNEDPFIDILNLEKEFIIKNDVVRIGRICSITNRYYQVEISWKEYECWIDGDKIRSLNKEQTKFLKINLTPEENKYFTNQIKIGGKRCLL